MQLKSPQVQKTQKKNDMNNRFTNSFLTMMWFQCEQTNGHQTWKSISQTIIYLAIDFPCHWPHKFNQSNTWGTFIHKMYHMGLTCSCTSRARKVHLPIMKKCSRMTVWHVLGPAQPQLWLEPNWTCLKTLRWETTNVTEIEYVCQCDNWVSELCLNALCIL